MKTTITLCFLSAAVSIYAQRRMTSDEFNGTVLDSAWIETNPNTDGQVHLTGAGELHMLASPLNGGSDMGSGSNYHAPRLLRPVCGTWTVEAKYHSNLTNDWQAAAIYYSVDSANAEGSIDATGYMRYGSPPPYCTEESSYYIVDTIVCRGEMDSIVWVRIEKSDTSIAESVSFDSINWQTRARAELRDVKYIGPACARQPYDGAMGVYTNMFVEYFRFMDQDTLHINASPGTVIGFGNAVELSVDTVANGAYAWYGPNGDLLGDSSLLVIDPADTADAGWYHVIVSRLDCQFATDSVQLEILTSIRPGQERSRPLAIHPNPATDHVRMSWANGQLRPKPTLVVMDAFGHVVHSRTDLTRNNAELNIAHLAPGAYFVRLQGEQWQAHGRFNKE